MPTRDLEQLAHAWSFLACLHPPPPQYASSSAWRLRVLEVLLEHPATAHDTRQGVEPGVGQRVEERTSEWDAQVMTRVCVLGHVAPLLLCGHAGRGEESRHEASPQACRELDLKMDLAHTASEHRDALAASGRLPPRMASWRAVVLLLRHTAAFSSTHVRMASCHALARLALELGEPVRVTIYQHLVSLCTEGNAIAAICATYLSALDEYYRILEAWHGGSSKQADRAQLDMQRQAVVDWRKRMQQLVVCTRSLDDLLLPYRQRLHPTERK